jgi:molybdopterin-guanine dinucleotide biosynthesis protein A
MGQDKASLAIGGETLLGRVVQVLGRVVPPEHIVCVAAPSQRLPPLPATAQITWDSSPNPGPLAALVTGFSQLDENVRAIYATGCDAPLLSPLFVERMFELLGAANVAAPHDGMTWQPLAAAYRREVLPLAIGLLANGARSLTALLEAADARRVSLDELRRVDPALRSLAPCNTPEEYVQLTRDETSRS